MINDNEIELKIISYNINGLTRFLKKCSLEEFIEQFNQTDLVKVEGLVENSLNKAKYQIKNFEESNKPNPGLESSFNNQIIKHTSKIFLLCLQETKMRYFDQYSSFENGFLSYHASSNSSYAGVATIYHQTLPIYFYSESEIIEILKTADISDKDWSFDSSNFSTFSLPIFIRLITNESRIQIFNIYDSILIFNLYMLARRNDTRLNEKICFENCVEILIDYFYNQNKWLMIFCGDLNLIHCEKDSNDGHSPSEWLKYIIKKYKFIDSHQNINKFTFWWQVNDDKFNNIGSRLDYILCTDPSEYDGSEKIENFQILHSRIEDQIEYSDHCPIQTTIKINFKDSFELIEKNITTNKQSKIYQFFNINKLAKLSNQPKKQQSITPILLLDNHLCRIHKKPCVLKKVKKKSMNFGRNFAACPESSCKYFKWI